MTPTSTPDAEEVRDDLLKDYPTKVARKRASQIVVNSEAADAAMPEITANVRTIPGIITQRGCTYAGCKGVVLGPTRDIVNITHGPIGCGFYSWLTRRNQTRPPTDRDENFIPYCFSTDMQEEDIIFGGEKKLRQAIQEAFDMLPSQGDRHLLHLPGGPDRRRRARRGPRNEGEAGHQRLRLQLRGLQGREPVGRAPHRQQRPVQARHRPGRHAARGKFSMNMLGEYNIGGDAFVLEDLFERCGITLHGHLQRQLHHGQVRERPHRRPERA